VSSGNPDTSSSTSLSLIDRVRAHDADAWRRLSRLYGPLVYRWARQAGLQESDAADLAQDVFGVLAAKISDFRRNRAGDSFRGWLWGITNNKLKEFFRRQAADPRAFGGTDAHLQLNALPEAPPEESREARLMETNASLIHRAMELIKTEFEENTWRAFWRTAIDEQTAPNVADELQMTSAAVRQAKCRVLRRLKQELEDLS